MQIYCSFVSLEQSRPDLDLENFLGFSRTRSRPFSWPFAASEGKKTFEGGSGENWHWINCQNQHRWFSNNEGQIESSNWRSWIIPSQRSMARRRFWELQCVRTQTAMLVTAGGADHKSLEFGDEHIEVGSCVRWSIKSTQFPGWSVSDVLDGSLQSQLYICLLVPTKDGSHLKQFFSSAKCISVVPSNCCRFGIPWLCWPPFGFKPHVAFYIFHFFIDLKLYFIWKLMNSISSKPPNFE